MPNPMTRRDLAKASIGGAIGAGVLVTSPAGAAGGMSAPTLTLQFKMLVTLGMPVEMGALPTGRRRFVPITGGTVSGPELEGIVLPGGGDWQTIGEDGTTEIHARYALRTTDGTVVEIDNPGVRVASPAVIARLTAGEDLDPSLYYFRTTPRFSVPAGKYDWLRRHVFVAVGIRHPATVEVRIFRVN
jgi:hypothetical protein